MTLLNWGFRNNKIDSFVSLSLIKKDRVLLSLYVVDILVTSNKLEHLTTFIHNLYSAFATKDLGPLHYFLGVQIPRTAKGFYLNQSQYISYLLTKFDMQPAQLLWLL